MNKINIFFLLISIAGINSNAAFQSFRAKGDVSGGIYASYDEACMHDADFLSAKDVVINWNSENAQLLDQLIAGFRNHAENVGIAESIIDYWHSEHADRLDQIVKSTCCLAQSMTIARAFMHNWRPEHKKRFRNVFENLYAHDISAQADHAVDDLIVKAMNDGNVQILEVFDELAEQRRDRKITRWLRELDKKRAALIARLYNS